MNNRCKFCGYRFKDKDEQICPECLTAREEDISCGVFGEEGHTHDKYDSTFSGEESFFARDDTFNDGRNTFLESERRDEMHTNAARYEREVEKMQSKARRVQIPEDPIYRQQAYTPPAYQPQSFDPNSRQDIKQPYQTNGQTAPQQKKPNCCGCIVFLAASIIVILIFTGIFSDIFDDSRSKRNEEASSSRSEAAVSTSLKVDEPVYENEEDMYTNFACYDSAVLYSDDSSYRVVLNDYQGYYYNPLDLNDRERYLFSVMDNDDFVEYDNEFGFGGYNMLSRVSVVLSDELLAAFKADEKARVPVEIAEVVCVGRDAAGEELCLYMADLVSTDFDAETGTLTAEGLDTYALQYCESITLEVLVAYNDTYENFAFEIDTHAQP